MNVRCILLREEPFLLRYTGRNRFVASCIINAGKGKRLRDATSDLPQNDWEKRSQVYLDCSMLQQLTYYLCRSGSSPESMRFVVMKRHFVTRQGEAGVNLRTVNRGHLCFMSFTLEKCLDRPTVKHEVFSIFLRSKKEQKVTCDITHLLLKVHVWKNAKSFHSGLKADQEQIIFHIVTKIPFPDVQKKLFITRNSK